MYIRQTRPDRSIHLAASSCTTTKCCGRSRGGQASEGILEALGGLYMHDSANELLRIPLPRTPLNKGKKSGDRRVRSSIRERGRCTCASHSRADVFVLEGYRARSSEL